MSRYAYAAPRTNRFAGTCVTCNNPVAAGEGILGGSRDRGWVTSHRSGQCPTPAVVGTPVEAGLYVAANGDFVKVVTSGYTGRLYGKRLVVREFDGRHVGDFVFDRTIDLTDANLSPVTAEAAAAAGLRWNICIRCAAVLGGETLSAKCSAVVGYGATCAANEGWFYPKGVVAQRALLAEHSIAV